MHILLTGDTTTTVVDNAQTADALYGAGNWQVSQGAVSPPDNRPYDQKRADEYKPVSEQLDMLYWDKINGTQNWQNHIAGVKAKHPKPNPKKGG